MKVQVVVSWYRKHATRIQVAVASVWCVWVAAPAWFAMVRYGPAYGLLWTLVAVISASLPVVLLFALTYFDGDDDGDNTQ